MTSWLPSFHTTRNSLRALLISSLVVLGHVLLTGASSPLPPPTLTSDPSPQITLKSISALISITILWITFSLLEAVDMVGSEQEYPVFCRTWAEGLLTGSLAASWIRIGVSPDACLIAEKYKQATPSSIPLVPLTYALIVLALVSLQLHLFLSIGYYAYSKGCRTLIREFWNGRAGHWTEHIELCDDEDLPRYIETHTSRDAEKAVGTETFKHSFCPVSPEMEDGRLIIGDETEGIWVSVREKMGESFIISL